MKYTHITEILSDKELNTVSADDTLSILLNNQLRDSTSTNYYMLDDRDVLCGIISERHLIRYLGGYIPFVDKTGLNNFLDNIDTVRIADVMETEFKSIAVDSYLTDIIPLLDECCGEIPVVDAKGRLLGEVTAQSILQRFEWFQKSRDESVLAQSC
jgi:CBS-domain-containing membrane protein